MQTTGIRFNSATLEEKPISNSLIKKGRKGQHTHRVNAVNALNNVADFTIEIADQFSSWRKLVRPTAYVFQSLWKKTFSRERDLTPEKLSVGEKVLFHLTKGAMHEDIEV